MHLMVHLRLAHQGPDDARPVTGLTITLSRSAVDGVARVPLDYLAVVNRCSAAVRLRSDGSASSHGRSREYAAAEVARDTGV